MAEKSETPAAPEAEGKGGGGLASKLPLVFGALNTVLLAGLLVLTLRGAQAKPAASPPSGEGQEQAQAEGGEAAEGEGGEKKPPGPGPTVRLPEFIVHLRDADTDRYARLSLEVEVQDDKAKDVVNGRLPQIRDAFLSYLSDRSVEELRGSEAMAQLKDALARKLRELAPGAPVKALYVTDLVIQ